MTSAAGSFTGADLKMPVAGYRRLRDEIDVECQKLENIHRDHLACRKGCTSCCMDFNIFPVEFYSIKEELGDISPALNTNAAPGDCIFLTDNLCSIYGSRPVICRTHGLPLLSMGEEDWELSHCELNFIKKPPVFEQSNTFPSDRYNSKLFLLNKSFIGKYKEKRYSEFELLPLSGLYPRVDGLKG